MGDYLTFVVYVALVIVWASVAIVIARVRAGGAYRDKRVRLIATAFLIFAVAAATDSLYWAVARAYRVGLVPEAVWTQLHEGAYALIPRLGLLAAAAPIFVLLHRHAIQKLSGESEETRRLGILQKTSELASSTLDLHELLRGVLPALLQLLGLQAAELYLVDEESQTFRLIDQFGSHPWLAAEPRRLRVDEGTIGQAAQTCGPVLVSYRRPRKSAEEDSAESNSAARAAYFPLCSWGKTIGVLGLFSRRRRQFTQDDLDLLMAVSQQLASNVHNAILFQQRELWLSEAERSAEALQQTVEERTEALIQAQKQVVEAEVQKRQFYKDMILAVSNGKLSLVEREEIQMATGKPIAEFGLGNSSEAVRARREVSRIAQEQGMTKERAGDLALCLGEATVNAIKHAGSGKLSLYSADSKLQVLIEDKGPGIDTPVLPRVAFEPGYSTKPSLGLGYTIMLSLADKVSLATGPYGTRLLIDVSLVEPKPDPLNLFPQLR